MFQAHDRELTDGYIRKEYGSGEKKEYLGIHSSILFASTNAIESFNSLYSILGQRIIFFRPKNNPKKARIRALQNMGKEKEQRSELHKTMLRFMNQILQTKKDRLSNCGRNLPEETVYRLGELCDFLAVVRTAVPKNYKGDVSAIPEPEFPTRLFKSICKLVDMHAIMYDREPGIIDELVGVRLIRDNIPTERWPVLTYLAKVGEDVNSEISAKLGLSADQARRILNDIKVLKIVEEDTGKGRAGNLWRVKPEFIPAISAIEATDSVFVRGVDRVTEDTNIDTYLSFFINNNSIIKRCSEHKCLVTNEESAHLPYSHPAQNSDAEENSPKNNLSMRDKAGILMDIRNEWYGASHPEHILEVKEMFEAELIIRCADTKEPMSRDAAKIYVTNAFRDWGWA
jgi:hypothetical protein